MSRSPNSRTRSALPLLVPFVVVLIAALAGCQRDPVGGALGPGDPSADGTGRWVSVAARMGSDTPPADIATVDFAGQSMHLWPYTGNSFDGTSVDPMNLIFVGKADPRAIRAALMSLDGNRTAFGMPDVYPFNATWSDAAGSVQTAYGDGEGWVGSVIQLQLGRYEYGRGHLRLFRTGKTFGSGGVWTLGAAHFEILIPGTADHQVLSWEVARQIVVVDLMRTGLLDAEAPLVETEVIYQAPTYRDIPPYIYNELPEELRNLIGGPPVPVSEPVGILSSGRATILNLAGEATIAPGTWTDAFTLEYGQFAPKPFCDATGTEWIYLEGPVSIAKTVTVDGSLGLSFVHALTGRLKVTPMDMTVQPPVPSGPSYYANVGEEQNGTTSTGDALVMAAVKQLGSGEGGVQMLRTRLRIGTFGLDRYTAEMKCLGPEETRLP